MARARHRGTGSGPRRRVATAVRRAGLAFLAMVVATAVAIGVATGVVGSGARSALYATGVYVDSGSSTVGPSFFSTPAPQTPTATPRGPDSPVLGGLATGKAPRASTLAERLGDLPDKDIGTLAYAIGDAQTSKAITSHNGSRAVVPASNLKLLTTVSALHVLGPDHTFTTSVVAPAPKKPPHSTSASTASPGTSSAGPETIVLVGGGDPYLAVSQSTSAYPRTSTLTDLAAQTAAALAKQKVTSVRLAWDASLFSGPAWNPTWPQKYRDQVTPTSALWVGEGRTAGGSPGPREAHPAQAATQAFAALLRKHHLHVTVTGSTPLGGHGAASASAQRLASVESMPLAEIVEQVLLHSDNDGAEVLFRHIAVQAGMTGTIAHARTATQKVLQGLHVWGSGMVMHDGSGLSRSDRVTATSLLKVLQLAVSGSHPELSALATGLPVAGSDGSLKGRFFAQGTVAGRGDVHAKTGTLTHVSALAGYAVTQDHAVVAFAFVLNDAKNDYNARVWLDRAAATVAACGCS